MRLEAQPPAEVLLHVEVESGEGVADLRRRMPRYHDFLGYKHGLPVLSLALYLGVALEGSGWDEAGEELWGESLGQTRWPYLGLPGLDALVYVEGDNLLGVAFSALMRVAAEKRAWLKARALQRIAEAELTVYKRFLLMDFIEAYLPLEGPHLDEFRHLLVTKEFTMALKIGKTSFEEGMEKGQRTVLGLQLEDKFGPLDTAVQERLEAMTSAQLRDLAKKLLKGGSLADLGLEDGAGP